MFHRLEVPVHACSYRVAQLKATDRAAEPKLLLQGAGHAVLKTLYSRAHRIGLDGVSCLLDGLCKSISSDFFRVVIVSALVCPALEVVILAEEQFQGFGDYVRRRRIDELGISSN